MMEGASHFLGRQDQAFISTRLQPGATMARWQKRFQPFSSSAIPKLLKQLHRIPPPDTGLKPGANERLQETRMRSRMLDLTRFFACNPVRDLRGLFPFSQHPQKKQTTMKKIILILAASALISLQSMAADAKSYQVTGPVLEITDSYVVVQKGDDKWQIACDKAMLGKTKVGDKVTIKYQMVAKSVETK
jgi:hypothetical protein